MTAAGALYLRAYNYLYHYKSLISASDSRLKLKQRPITGALATVVALQPRLYEKRDSLDDTEPPTVTESGFIAQ